MPAAISIYWIAQAVFGTAQDVILTKHYRKVYDAEDAVRQERLRFAAPKRRKRSVSASFAASRTPTAFSQIT